MTSGEKYRRVIPTGQDGKSDAYDVLEAFAVTCPARQHAITKLLCAGLSDKGDALQDLRESADAVARAEVLEAGRVALATPQALATTGTLSDGQLAAIKKILGRGGHA